MTTIRLENRVIRICIAALLMSQMLGFARPARALQPTMVDLFLPLLAKEYDPRLETEPNGTEALADGPVMSGVVYVGYHNTGPALDSDYWRFEASGAGPVHIDVAGLDSAGQVIATRVGGGQIGYVGGPPFVIDTTAPVAGQYVVRVVSSAALGVEAYTVTVTYP